MRDSHENGDLNRPATEVACEERDGEGSLSGDASGMVFMVVVCVWLDDARDKTGKKRVLEVDVTEARAEGTFSGAPWVETSRTKLVTLWNRLTTKTPR